MFCRMMFESYPLDEQICYFLIGSPKHLENSGQFFEHDWIKFNSSEQVALQGYRIEIKPVPRGLAYLQKLAGLVLNVFPRFWEIPR